jgi:hypothetical protein
MRDGRNAVEENARLRLVPHGERMKEVKLGHELRNGRGHRETEVNVEPDNEPAILIM